MRIGLWVLMGLLGLATVMCSKTDDPNEDNNNTNGEGGETDTSTGTDTSTSTGDDDDDSSEEDDKVHYGCVEKAGEACLQMDAEGACLGNDLCQWGVGQCLPNGFGCRNERTRAGCEGLGYCVFSVWEEESPCMYACGIHWDENSCNNAEGCAWSNGRFCRPQKQVECREQTDQASCEAVADCAYTDSCTIAGMCNAINDEAACTGQDGCEWQDGSCLFKCQLKFATQEECEAEDTDSDALACRWSNREKLCIAQLHMQDMGTCRPLDATECDANDKCRLVKECDLNVNCRRLSEEVCTESDYCTAGLCEHICTPKNSPQGCEDLAECMWISVKYESGQTCITACHHD